MKLNYKQLGEGFPLLILHGLFGSLDNWITLSRQFSSTYSVYMIDARNHGRSPHDPVSDYPSMVEDLRSFMEDHSIEQAHIIGHSMGGKTAMSFTLNHPEKVSKLVVADMAMKAYSGHHDEVIRAMQDIPISEIKNRSEAESILAVRIPELGVRQFLLKNIDRREDGSYAWKINLPVLVNEYPKILMEVKGTNPVQNEVLFIRGGNSDYLKDKDFESAKLYFPNASLQTIEGAGHWIHAEQPGPFFTSVSHFLQS